jgi:precorrin-2/cobalt-factor-2 C20-methyltransferase
MTTGRFWTVGVGPGDPDLMTLKAARVIAAAPVIAFFAKAGRPGHARTIADRCIAPGAEEIRLQYPFTTEVALDDPCYAAEMTRFYNDAAARMAQRLDRGLDVALLCEGDPFFYGSSMVLFDRLGGDYSAEIVPGVTGMSGCWSSAATPMLHGDDVLSVLPGTLPQADLTARLATCDAAVIMKVGRNLPKIRASLDAAGRLDRSIYVERGTMPGQRIRPLSEWDEATAPYFSLVLVPGRQRPR